MQTLNVSKQAIKNGVVAIVGLNDFAMLNIITAYSNDRGESHVTLNELAEKCGLTRVTVIRAINRLVAASYEGEPILLRETYRKGQPLTFNRYKVNPNIMFVN